jgi:thiol-disulfide isomerase/thioredoxin
MANPPAKKVTNSSAKSGAAKKPATKRPAARRGGRPAGMFTWILVGVVVVAIVSIVLVKITNGSSVFVAHPISSTIQSELTTVPASTFDTVGVTSPSVPTNPLPVTKGQPLLLWPDSQGTRRPTVFYVGAEYCPYCAAERWPMIVALSRFGTWSNLYTMLSSSSDVYPNTPTFTFLHATYSSKYINFDSVETQDRDHNTLQKMTTQQSAIFFKYMPQGSIPFASIGNQSLVLGASPSPSAFTNASRDQIASVLADPTNPLAQGIISAANYISAGVCHMDHNQPSNVCTSSGVKAAAAKMGI